MKYIASVRDKETKERMLIEREYDKKMDFYYDLRANGYSVRFITTEDKFDEDCEKYDLRCQASKRYHQLMAESNKKFAAEMNMSVAEYKRWLNR